MSYSYKSPNVRRVLSVAAATVLCASTLTGCFGLGGKETEPSTEPVAPPSLIESTAATEAPETTEAPTEPEESNIAIVKEQVNVRQSPSKDAAILSQLDAGDEVEIAQIHSLGGIKWAYIPLKGWVPVDSLDMSKVTSVQDPSSTPANPEGTEPSDTPSEGGNTTGSTTVANGKVGVITATELNIRAQANTTSDIVGSLKYGDVVTIEETANGWGKISKGWISMNYVYQEGTPGAHACKGLVTGTRLNVRKGPGTNYDIVNTLTQGARVNVLETFKIGDYTWGSTKEGWLRMDYVYVDGTEGEGSGTGTVTGDNVNIRSGPGTAHEIVGSVSSGQTVKIYAQFTFGNTKWGSTDNGWICMDYVNMG